MPTVFIILIIALAVPILYGIVRYNSFIAQVARVDEAWADIDVQLKRRYDLIPNLMDTVKGYMEHEQETFQKVTEARTQAMQAGTVKEQEGAENMLSGALKSLFAVSESYPELRATENFQKFQDELADTENKIQAARRFYNANVRDYNTDVDQFPANVIANMASFDKRDFFELQEDSVERENVNVEF